MRNEHDVHCSSRTVHERAMKIYIIEFESSYSTYGYDMTLCNEKKRYHMNLSSVRRWHLEMSNVVDVSDLISAISSQADAHTHACIASCAY